MVKKRHSGVLPGEEWKREKDKWGDRVRRRRKENRKLWTRGEFLFCAVTIWTAALFQAYGLYQQKKEEEKTLEAFETLQLSDLKGCIEITAPLEKIYKETEGKKTFLTGLIRELDLDEEIELTEKDANGRNEVGYQKETQQEKIQITLVTEQCMTEEENESERMRENSSVTEYQYVHFLYENRDDMEQLLQYKTKIERRLKMRGMAPASNLNVRGRRSGTMTLTEKREVTDRLFEILQAVWVEAVREEDWYTVYGYSELLQNSFSYGKKKINVTLAFSYWEEKNETQFNLAMPYVLGDY